MVGSQETKQEKIQTEEKEAPKAEEERKLVGTVAVVAKTAGIKLKENEDKWLNPANDKIKETVMNASLKGKAVTILLDEQGKYTGFREPTPGEKMQLKSNQLRKQADLNEKQREQQKEAQSGTGLELARSLGLVQDLQGREYINHAGLLVIAHRMNLKNIDTEIIEHDFAQKTAIVKAKVTMSGERRMDPEKTFTGLGDSTPENTTKLVQNAFLRMAETRAVCRALRAATGVGLTSLEELPDGKPAKEEETPPAEFEQPEQEAVK